MNDVTVRLIGRRRMVGTNDLGHSIVMDTPIEFGGDDSGMRPLELVLYGLAGCTGMDVVAILEKQRQNVTHVSVRATGVQTESKPSRYERIDITYEVVGVGVKPEFVARAIELSEERYCSVRACLAPDIMLTSTYHVLEESRAHVVKRRPLRVRSLTMKGPPPWTTPYSFPSTTNSSSSTRS